MKKVIYLLSAAALLTVGIIACSKEQAIQNTSITELENKNGRPDGAGQEGKMMELALSTELRNIALEKTPELGTLIHDHPTSAVDAKGNIVEGVIRISLNTASGRISRIEISENVARLKGAKRNTLIDADLGNDIPELAAAGSSCINECNKTENAAKQICYSKEGESFDLKECLDEARRQRNGCVAGCVGNTLVKIGEILCKILC